MSCCGAPPTVEEMDELSRLVSGKLAAFLRTLRDASFAVGLREGQDAAALLASGYGKRPGLLRSAFKHLFSARKADWEKVAKVWYRVVDYINDPKTHDDAIRIMAARVGLPPAEYEGFVKGTHILTLAEAKKHFAKGSTFTSIYGSSKIADDFNVANKVYEKPQAVDSYFDAGITSGL